MPAQHPQARPLCLIGTTVLLLCTGVAAGDSDTPSLNRLKWQCTEQPATRVVVNAQGQLASELQPASISKPVQVHAIVLDPTASGPKIPTRLISTVSDLVAPAANWSPKNDITSHNGRIRLDLTDNRTYLVTNAFGNQSLFRRFDCQTAGKEAPIHYDCGPDFDLWISFNQPDDALTDASSTKADTGDGGGDPGADHDSASIHYPGGHIELPRARSGSGARYAQADSILWIKGDSATFTLAGDEEHRCQVDD